MRSCGTHTHKCSSLTLLCNLQMQATEDCNFFVTLSKRLHETGSNGSVKEEYT